MRKRRSSKNVRGRNKDNLDNISAAQKKNSIKQQYMYELEHGIMMETSFKLLFENMMDGFAYHKMLYDCDGKPNDYVFLEVNSEFEKHTGLKRANVIGKRVLEILPNVGGDWIETYGRVAKTGVSERFENYSESLCKWYSISVYSPQTGYFAVIMRDITDQKRREDEYRYLSYHDVLTGLYNRRFLEEEIKRLDTERNLPISIIMGDVNSLKLVNDAFGHDKGDELLYKAAVTIRSSCRSEDLVARWGGDEFMIVLPNTNSKEIVEIINKIKNRYSNENVNSLSVSISFGWETKRSADEDILNVLKNAEDYMYKHKIIENEGMRANTIRTILNTLHEKNPREEQHSQRVSEICQKMGSVLGLSEIKVSKLKVVGLLHDIGKIAIDDSILNKPGKLTERERNEINRHPDIGYRILCSSSEMLELADCILAHHERWDGTGYPRGLKGEAIPTKARILALADTYDAMTSERPYRKTFNEEKAITEIRKNAGTQFDPELARVFVEKVLGKEWD